MCAVARVCGSLAFSSWVCRSQSASTFFALCCGSISRARNGSVFCILPSLVVDARWGAASHPFFSLSWFLEYHHRVLLCVVHRACCADLRAARVRVSVCCASFISLLFFLVCRPLPMCSSRLGYLASCVVAVRARARIVRMRVVYVCVCLYVYVCLFVCISFLLFVVGILTALAACVLGARLSLASALCLFFGGLDVSAPTVRADGRNALLAFLHLNEGKGEAGRGAPTH